MGDVDFIQYGDMGVRNNFTKRESSFCEMNGKIFDRYSLDMCSIT